MMSNYILLFLLIAVVLLVIIGLLMLFFEFKKLKEDHRYLSERLRRNNEDVAGLCSAAVELDQHIASSDAQLNAMMDVVNNLQETYVQAMESETDMTQDYQKAIQKIRMGVSVEELVKDCGLTMDEAVLLNRLHGGRH